MIRILAKTFSTCCTVSKASKDVSTPQLSIFTRTEKRRITRRSREPSVSTRVPDDSDEPDEPDEPDELDDAQLLGSPPRVIKEIDKARVKRNLIKMRVSVRRLVRDLKNFNIWALQKYKSAGNCFTEVAGHPHANHVMLDVFVNRSEALGFDGNSENVFYGLSEAFEHSWDDSSKALVVTRSTFTKRLSSMGSPLPNLVHPASDEDDKVEPRMAKMRLHELTQPEIAQLIFFRNFVEPLFASPGQVFDAIAGEDCVVDESGFVAWLATYHYPGDSNKVYHCFCEQGSIMTRFVFCDVLGNCKKLDPQQQDQNAPQMDQSSQNKVEPNHGNAGHSTTNSERELVEQIVHDMKPLKETPGDAESFPMDASNEEPGANDNPALKPSGENRDEVGTPARTLPCLGESRHTVHIQIPEEEEGKKRENKSEEDDGDVTKKMEKSGAAFAGEDRISGAASDPPMEVDHIDLQGACDVSPQAAKCEDDAKVTPGGHRRRPGRRPSLSCTDHNDDEASSKTPSQAAEGTAAVQGKRLLRSKSSVAQNYREDSGKLPSQVAESPPGEKGKLRRRSLTSIDSNDKEESIKAPLRRTSSAPPGIEQYDHKGPGKAATAAARFRKALTATAATAATRFASFRWRRKSKGSPDENIQGVSSAPHPQVAKSGEDVPKSEAPPQYSTEASTGGDQNAVQTTEDSGKVITRRPSRRKSLSSIGPEDTEATVVTRRSVRRKSLTSLDTDDIEATAITRRPGRRKSLTTIDPDDAEAAIKVPTHGVTKVTSCEAPASVDQGHLLRGSSIPDDVETASEAPAKDARRRSKSSTSSGADVQDSGKSVSPDARGGGRRSSKTSPRRRSRRSMTLLASDIQDDLQDSVKSVTPQDDLQDSDKHASPDARGGGRRSSKTSPRRRSKRSMTLLTSDIQQDLQDAVSSETPTAKGNERRRSKPSIDQDEIEKSKGG